MFMLIYVPDLYGPTIPRPLNLLPSTLWLHLQILFINYEIMRLTIGPVPPAQSGLLFSLWLYRNQKLLKTTKANQTQQAVISPNLPHAMVVVRACWHVTGQANRCYLPICDSWGKITPLWSRSYSCALESQQVEFSSLPGGSLLLRLGLVMEQYQPSFSCVAWSGHALVLSGTVQWHL